MARNSATPNTQPEKPKRTRNATGALTIGQAFDRIDTIRRTQSARIQDARAAVIGADSEKEQKILARLSETDLKALEPLLAAAEAQRRQSDGDADKTAWLHKDPPETSGRVEVERP